MKRILRYKTLLAVSLCVGLAPSLARAYGGDYYGRPFAIPSNGAALGPWPWNFDIGGGPTAIAGDTRDRMTSGWNFTMGGGYNFTPRAGFVLEFSQSGLGLTDAEIRSNHADGGDADIWSITMNPIWRFRIAGPIGGYLIGGGGYYQLEERFNKPGEVFVPGFGGGFFVPGEIFVREFDDAGGVDAGAGLTCNLGWGTKFFMEARYHYIFTSGTPTQIIPITFGLRW